MDWIDLAQNKDYQLIISEATIKYNMEHNATNILYNLHSNLSVYQKQRSRTVTASQVTF